MYQYIYIDRPSVGNQIQMVRKVKSHDVRKKEILDNALELFQSIGYSKTTVEEIINRVGIAKGTFYHYFTSKQEVLSILADNIVNRMAESAQSITEDPKMSALEKVKMILRGSNPAFDEGYEVTDFLHLPENRELHERINTKTILLFGPILVKVIEQGQLEGIFSVERPLETVQFLLAGSSFIFNSALFNWSDTQVVALSTAMQSIIECSLGLKRGTFSFLAEPYEPSSKNTHT